MTIDRDAKTPGTNTGQLTRSHIAPAMYHRAPPTAGRNPGGGRSLDSRE